MSKRFVVTVAGRMVNAFLVWHAINMCAIEPEASTAIAGICATCVAAMVAAQRKYVDGETSRPSVRRE